MNTTTVREALLDLDYVVEDLYGVAILLSSSKEFSERAANLAREAEKLRSDIRAKRRG